MQARKAEHQDLKKQQDDEQFVGGGNIAQEEPPVGGAFQLQANLDLPSLPVQDALALELIREDPSDEDRVT